MPTNPDIIQSIYANFAKGDVAAVLGVFDSRVEWNEAEGFVYADGNPYVGPQAVLTGILQRISSDVAGFTVIPERIIDGGEIIVAEGRYRGTMKSTNTAIDSQFAHVWQLSGGKVVRFQQYTDTRQWADAVRGK